MDECCFCNYKENKDEIAFENDFCVCITNDDPILISSCMIIPKAHKETPFDLSPEEWQATKDLLDKIKNHLDAKCNPDGYNLGWNIGSVAGQSVFHAHLHVIPRYKDEPYAGFGIRHWLKSSENKRPK